MSSLAGARPPLPRRGPGDFRKSSGTADDSVEIAPTRQDGADAGKRVLTRYLLMR